MAVLLLAASTAVAKNGTAFYKTKCAGCHGEQGEGKVGPKLAATSLSEADIVNVLTKGGQPKAPHMKAFIAAAVMALVLVDGFRRGWRFVLQSWKQYVSVLFGGVAVLVAALVIVMVAVAFSKQG